MKRWITYLIVIIIIGASAGGILARRYYFKDEGDGEVKSAQMGDTVSVHYTGWLQDDRIYEDWRIFDTSRENIAGQTTLTFSSRERGDPFKFTVGEGVIEGWSESMIGMKEGDSKIVNIPPEKAYDTWTDDLIFEVDKRETIPVYEKMNTGDFTGEYGTEPSVNMVVTDTFWNWKQTVISTSGSTVQLRNDPEVGKVYRTYKHGEAGWSSKPLSIDTNADQGKGEIEVQHYVDAPIVVDANHLVRHDDRFVDVFSIKNSVGQSRSSDGIVVEVGEKIVIDFNEEVAGKTLRFKITLLDIQEGEEQSGIEEK